MQLYSMEQQRSQALEAHAAAFSTHQVPGNTVKSQVVAFAQKTLQPDGGALHLSPPFPAELTWSHRHGVTKWTHWRLKLS